MFLKNEMPPFRKGQWIIKQCDEINATFSKRTNRSPATSRESNLDMLSQRNGILRWEKPPPRVIKINIDGSISGARKEAKCGGVKRDEHSEWHGGFTKFLGICNPLEIEAWGILGGY